MIAPEFKRQVEFLIRGKKNIFFEKLDLQYNEGYYLFSLLISDKMGMSINIDNLHHCEQMTLKSIYSQLEQFFLNFN